MTKQVKNLVVKTPMKAIKIKQKGLKYASFPGFKDVSCIPAFIPPFPLSHPFVSFIKFIYICNSSYLYTPLLVL